MINIRKRKFNTIKSIHDDDSENDIGSPLELLTGHRSHVSVDMEDNHIYFREDVNKQSIIKLIKLISEANCHVEDLIASCKVATIIPKPIYLHITSHGGEVHYGLMAYDVIKRSKIPIYTICEGFSYSAGTIIGLAGVKRYATPNTYLLVHQLSNGACGNFEQLKDQHANDNIIMERLKKLYLENTKMKSKELDSLLKRDLLLDTKTCIKYGLIDNEFYGE